MATFCDFLHKRYKTLGKVKDVSVNFIASPRNPLSLVGGSDRFLIVLDEGDHTASLSLSQQEIDQLVSELSKLNKVNAA